MAIKFTKDPQAKLDYTLDWSQWLVAGDTISDLTATVTPTGSLTVDSTTFTDTTSTTWLSGGTAGSYTVTHHITTADGREDDRSMTITIKDK